MARKDSAQRAQAVAGGFATAAKNITIQFNGRERSTDNILAKVRIDAASKGVKDEEIDLVDVYIKPEEQTIYYVINKEIEGSISF